MVGCSDLPSLCRRNPRSTSSANHFDTTVSLDARAEHALFDTIRGLRQGRTILPISHRFSTVRSADRIHVVKDGTIVEG
jgi:ABC-type transport system involved in Fe-S cluster assembly fused permease/ATPase subunit